MAASSDPRIKLTSALTRAKRIATGCTRPAATPFTSSSSEAQEPSVIPPQLDAIRMRARTLTAFSTPLHLADFSNRRLIPSPPSVESLPKSSASSFRIFHSLFLCESCDLHHGGREFSNAKWTDIFERDAEKWKFWTIVDGISWIRMARRMVTTSARLSLFYEWIIDGNERE